MLRADAAVTHRTDSPEGTEALGRSLAPRLRAGDVLLAFGDLGSGKTTFVRGLHAGLGCDGRVRSPSYLTLIEYAGPLPLYHFDLYRYEAAAAGFFEEFGEWLGGEGVTVIEWADRIAAAKRPETALHVRFALDGAERIVIAHGSGTWPERLRGWR